MYNFISAIPLYNKHENNISFLDIYFPRTYVYIL